MLGMTLQWIVSAFVNTRRSDIHLLVNSEVISVSRFPISFAEMIFRIDMIHAFFYFFFLQIRDGFFQQSTLIGKFCGNLQRFTINSTSNTINIILVSSSNTNIRYRGFKAKYKSNVKGTCTNILYVTFNIKYLPLYVYSCCMIAL